MNHSYYLPWSKEGKYKYILCGYKYYGVEVGPYYRPNSIIFIISNICFVFDFLLAEELFLYVFTTRGKAKRSCMTGEKTYGGKHAKLPLFPNQNSFIQLPLFTICNLTNYYILPYTICQRVVLDYFYL